MAFKTDKISINTEYENLPLQLTADASNSGVLRINSYSSELSGFQLGFINDTNEYITFDSIFSGSAKPFMVINRSSNYVGFGGEISPQYTIDVSGNINIDGSIFQNGVLFEGGGGGISEVSSATTNQLTVTNGTTTPTLSIVTNSIINGGTSLATGDQIYDFVTGLGYTTNTGTVTSVATSGAITGGTITSTGTISHSTADGYKHIPSGGAASQILQYSAAGTAQWYTPPWTTNIGDITAVTAGNGLTGGGTTGGVTLNVASHAGTAGSIGTINISADAIGVNLGTSSTTAFRGDYGNTAYTHVSSSGTDHSYINQSVTTAASPTFAALTINGAVTSRISGGDIGRFIGGGDGNDYLEIDGGAGDYARFVINGATILNTTASGVSITGTLSSNSTISASGGNSDNWNSAYTHISSTGTDHSYINQSVTTGASPYFVNCGISSGNGRGLRFWNSDSYKIYMSTYDDTTWGGRLDTASDYNMYFRMTSGTNRGFVFQNSTTSVAQIEGNGNFRNAGSIISSGSITATSFSGAGTGLTGTASSLSIGGNAATATWADAVDVNTSASTSWFGVLWNSGDTVYTAAGKLEVQPSSGALRSDGEITGYYSDKRLKTNIITIDNPIDKINKISGIYFNPNELAKKYLNENTKERKVGVIAQDLQNILPEAVKYAPFDRDTSNNSISGEDYLTVQYEKIVPLLIEGIKQNNKENIELKETIETLEDRIKLLEEKLHKIS